jgi:hypothetical protein
MRRSEATSGTLLLVALAFPKTIAILTTFVIGEKWLMADQDAVPKRDGFGKPDFVRQRRLPRSSLPQ